MKFAFRQKSLIIAQPLNLTTMSEFKKYYTEDGGLKEINEKGEMEISYGEAATEEELNELRGLTNELGFVPKDPKESESYYKRKAYNVLNRYHMARPEAMELFKYYNSKLVDVYADNPELIKEKISGEKKSENIFRDQIHDFYKENIASLVKNEEFYSLPVGKTLNTSKQFEKQYFGYSFTIKLLTSRENSLDNTFIFRNDSSSEEYMGRINIDIDTGDINITLMPLASENNQRNYNVKQDQLESEKLKVLMGFYHWLRYPEQINAAWTGERRPGGLPKDGEFSPINVGREIKENTLPYRRRIISNTQEAFDKATELLRSLSADYINTATENNGGELSLNIHYLSYSSQDEGGRWSDTFSAYLNEEKTGFLGNCVFDRAQIESLTQEALRFGQKAVISVRSCWSVPELEGSPRGVSPRGNLKRLKQKATGRIVKKIFLPKYDNNGNEYDPKLRTRARQLFERNEKENNLTEDERSELKELLIQLNTKEVAENLFTVASSNGMHFANGSYMAGNTWKDGGGANYVIRPKKMKTV